MKMTIGRLVSILHRQAQVYFNRVLMEFDISSAEYAFLICLYKKGGITQDGLSSYLCIDKAATARAIKSLERKGYAVRKKDDLDKRINRVYPSEKALKYEDEIMRRIHGWSEFLMEGIDEETINTVVSVLQKMVRKVENTDLKKEAE